MLNRDVFVDMPVNIQRQPTERFGVNSAPLDVNGLVILTGTSWSSEVSRIPTYILGIYKAHHGPGESETHVAV